MSIIDSTEELTAAQARLEGMSDDQLAVDLVYWATATQDAIEEHDAISEVMRAKKRQYLEAQHWTSLVVGVLRKRRDAKRAKADG